MELDKEEKKDLLESKGNLDWLEGLVTKDHLVELDLQDLLDPQGYQGLQENLDLLVSLEREVKEVSMEHLEWLALLDLLVSLDLLDFRVLLEKWECLGLKETKDTGVSLDFKDFLAQ